MSTKQKTDLVTQQSDDQKLMDGLKKHETTVPSFLVSGKTVKVADVITAVQANIGAANAVEPARATWQTAVQAARDQRVKTRPLASAVRQSLRLMFAGAIDTLAEFGLKPRKARTPLTPEQKAASVAKAKATRAARHTMGTKQKKAVKGTVTTIVAPAASPAAPVAAGSVASAPAQGTSAGTAPRIP